MESFLSNNVFLRGLNKKSLIAAGLVAILIISISLVAIRKDVVLVYDGNEVEVSTFAGTVEGLLLKQGIEVNEGDKVVPELSEKLKDGIRITIHRSFEIKLVEGQQEKKLMTAEKTVENLLNSLDIQLGKDDRVEPNLQASLYPGETIKIIRVTKEVVTEEKEIPFQMTTKYNDNLDYGKTNLLQQGKTGVMEIQSQITYEDGTEVAREVIGEKVLQEVVHEVVEKGTARMLVTSRGDTRRYKDAIIMEASAYTAGYASTGKNPGDPYYGITRSGTRVRPGVVAVDPKVVPLGTKLYVESTDRTPDYGLASAEDTGSAIKGNKIDLFFENREDALRFGRRKVKVYILD